MPTCMQDIHFKSRKLQEEQFRGRIWFQQWKRLVLRYAKEILNKNCAAVARIM